MTGDSCGGLSLVAISVGVLCAKNSLRVGRFSSVVSFRVLSRVVWMCLSRHDCARVPTVILQMSSSISASAVTSVLSRDNASAAWCLIPALWMILKSYSISRHIHFASFSVTSASLRIHFNAWWSVQTVNLVPSKYGRDRSIAHTTARYSRCMVSWLLSVLQDFWQITDWYAHIVLLFVKEDTSYLSITGVRVEVIMSSFSGKS